MGRAVAIVVAVWGFACGNDEKTTTPPPTELTYYKDVEPIVQVHCLGCHSAGGIGPIEFSADTVEGIAGQMAAETMARRMPPWQPSDLGPALAGARLLDQTQIDTIVAWAAAGAPLGDPADHVDRDPLRVFALENPTHAFTIPAAYVPDRSQEDDVRCFVIELPFTTTNTWVRALRFNMDKRVMVHHIGAGIASGAEAQKARMLDAAEPAPGYNCPGGFRVQLSSGLGIGGPGAEGYEYPAGAGVFIPAGSVALMTVHYYTPYAGPDPDQSGVDLWVSSTPLRPMGQMTLTGPSELPCPGGISTNPSDRCSRDWALAQPGAFTPVVNTAINNNILRHCGYDVTELDDGLDFSNPTAEQFLVARACIGEIPYSGTLRLISTHMHTRGASSRIEVERAGAWVPLFDIPRWDWHWESSYLLADTVTVDEGERLRVSCSFDNGVTAQPPDPSRGNLPEPVRYVTAAEGRTDEMCGGTMWIERTAGAGTLCMQAKALYDGLCPSLPHVSTAIWGGACDATAESLAVQLMQTPDAVIPYFWCDVEPTNTTGQTCTEELQCAIACAGNPTCVAGCEAAASPRADHRFDRLLGCAAQWCAGDTGALWSACLGVACGAEYRKCIGP